MPAVYDKMGIRFLYPENWTLDEGEAVEGSSVTVYSPLGAFWSVVVHPSTSEPPELAVAAMAALKAEYPATEAEPADDQIGDLEIRGYDVSFFYLDFVNTATIRAFRTANASCLVLCQAEDRDYEQLAPIFLAITTSLLAPR